MTRSRIPDQQSFPERSRVSPFIPELLYSLHECWQIICKNRCTSPGSSLYPDFPLIRAGDRCTGTAIRCVYGQQAVSPAPDPVKKNTVFCAGGMPARERRRLKSPAVRICNRARQEVMQKNPKKICPFPDQKRGRDQTPSESEPGIDSLQQVLTVRAVPVQFPAPFAPEKRISAPVTGRIRGRPDLVFFCLPQHRVAEEAPAQGEPSFDQPQIDKLLHLLKYVSFLNQHCEIASSTGKFMVPVNRIRCSSCARARRRESSSAFPFNKPFALVVS